MPKGKMRTTEEIARMQKDIRRKHRPLLRKMEILSIREKTLDWVMGSDDPFVEPEVEPINDGALDMSAEEAGEVAE